MNFDGVPHRTIWTAADGRTVEVIDQTRLPFNYEVLPLWGIEDASRAIETMVVRAAPLIGATAAYGMALALAHDASDDNLEAAAARLMKTRPTGVNLRWAVDEMTAVLRNRPRDERVEAAYDRAAEICDEDVTICSSIAITALKC